MRRPLTGEARRRQEAVAFAVTARRRSPRLTIRRSWGRLEHRRSQLGWTPDYPGRKRDPTKAACNGRSRCGLTAIPRIARRREHSDDDSHADGDWRAQSATVGRSDVTVWLEQMNRRRVERRLGAGPSNSRQSPRMPQNTPETRLARRMRPFPEVPFCRALARTSTPPQIGQGGVWRNRGLFRRSGRAVIWSP